MHFWCWLVQEFQASLAKLVEVPWRIATKDDKRSSSPSLCFHKLDGWPVQAPQGLCTPPREALLVPVPLVAMPIFFTLRLITELWDNKKVSASR